MHVTDPVPRSDWTDRWPGLHAVTSRKPTQLRAAGWSYGQIAAEWRQRHGFNSRVAFRLAHGLTQSEVAQRWNEQWPDPQSPKTAKQISYWEIWPAPGGRCPSLDTLNRLAYLYRCSAGELLGGADYSHLDSVHASRIAGRDTEPAPTSAAALVPMNRIGVVTESVVADFEMLTETYRRLDYRNGAQAVAGDVAVHLRRMVEVSNRTPTTSAHRLLLRAVGDGARLGAWLAIDGQRYEQARRYCQLAVSMADKANDRALHAYTLGVVSYIHLHAGRRRRSAARPGHRPRDRRPRGAAGGQLLARGGHRRGPRTPRRAAPGRHRSRRSRARLDGVTADNTPSG